MSGWDEIRRAAEIESHQFSAALANPVAAQEAVLRNLLGDNSDTEFGLSHGFSKISSVRDFQRAAPIAGYDEIKPSIERVLAGQRNVLTTAPIVACEETGGTSGGVKLIPYTEQSLRAFRSAILPSLSDLVHRRPGIAHGKIYASISPATRLPRKTSGGISIGLSNDAAYLGADLIPAFASLLAVSPDVGAISNFGDWRKATLNQLSSCKSLSFVSIWSPTFWLELIRGLDVENLWPELDTVSCWTDGPSSFLASQLHRHLPGVHIAPKGLLSTESPVTVAFGEDEGCVPALTSAFIEFVDESGEALLLDQLSPGHQYRVVMSTPGGLYRYDTQDLVRCVSSRGGVPRLVFMGRAGNVSDMVGEKLDEAFVAEALREVPVAARLVARAAPTPHYELWLESPVPHAARTVEAKLELNPQYAFARKMGQLGEILPIVRPDFWASFGSGHRLGVVKPSVLQRLQSFQS